MEARSFDYVVVGGGSSGCIVAARLAARGSVLLLEAGDRAEDNPETLRADGYKEAFINDRLMFDRFTVPQPGCGGRRRTTSSTCGTPSSSDSPSTTCTT